MSFTDQEDKDNYATDKKGWELIKNFIPKDKVIWAPFYCDGKQTIFNKCCERLKELDKPFILVGFARVLLMKWFQKLFKDDLQVIIPFTRITFTHLIHPKKGYTPPFGTYYFCWKMNLPKDLIFLD
jgi:hypothetical protein